MRPSHALACTLLLSSAFGLCLAAAAQASSEGAPVVSQVTVLHATHMLNTCPVSLRAQHGANASLQQAEQGRPKGVAQLLHLTLVDPQSKSIVKARLRVHGLSGKARATQTLTDTVEPDAIQTLNVRFTTAPGKPAVADLWVPAMTAVLKIDISSVTYADGTTRNFSVSDGCRVTPDPLMLVSAR